MSGRILLKCISHVNVAVDVQSYLPTVGSIDTVLGQYIIDNVPIGDNLLLF